MPFNLDIRDISEMEDLRADLVLVVLHSPEITQHCHD